MPNDRNYQKELECVIEQHQKRREVHRLLLHSCCAPCSSYVLEYLSNYFQITLFYYNPNIYPEEEYHTRVLEQKRLISEMPTKYPVHFIEGNYEPKKFFDLASGMEDIPEGGVRCFKCYELRLREAALQAKKSGCDYFTTTLSISPMKNARKLNEIGEKLQEELKVSYLNSDFKKKDGYKRSLELSKEYHLYRQNFCGCVYSR